MYQFEIKFIGSKIEFEAIHNLASAWKNNGQILHPTGPIFKQSSGVFLINVITPTRFALSKKNNNVYVNERLKQLIKQKVLIKINLKGYIKDPVLTFEEYKKADSLVLYFNDSLTTFESPVKDFNNFKTVPLFYLPKLFDNTDYWNLIQWMKRADAAETLSDTSNKGRKNLQYDYYNLKGMINLRGRELCKIIEDLTQKSTYYYFNRYTSNTSVKRELNFNFSDEFESETHLDLFNDTFQFINYKERLISNITPNLLEDCRKAFHDRSEISSLKSVKL